MNNEASIEHKVDQLISLISGNPLDENDTGLAGDVKELKDKMLAMEKRDKLLIGIVIGLGIFAGAGFSQFLSFVSQFFK